MLQPNPNNRLRAVSVVRLSNLITLSAQDIDRAIGYIPDALHQDLLGRLADQRAKEWEKVYSTLLK